jgi:hypothetical protein
MPERAEVSMMNVIELHAETNLELYVRYGLVPESAIPDGMRAIAEQTRRAKRGEL